ncbi:Replication-associated protein [Dirofilaria immitis]
MMKEQMEAQRQWRLRELLHTIGNGLEYGITGHETCPTTLRIHYQCYFKFISPVRFSTLSAKLPRGSHIEKAKRTPYQNYQYCSKETIKEEIGTRPNPPNRKRKQQEEQSALLKRYCSNEINLQQMIEEDILFVMKDLPRIQQIKSYVTPDRNTITELYIIIGDPGIGKTTFATKLTKSYFIKTANTEKWWDGYENQELVMLDDFYGWLLPAELFNLADSKPISADCPGLAAWLLCALQNKRLRLYYWGCVVGFSFIVGDEQMARGRFFRARRSFRRYWVRRRRVPIPSRDIAHGTAYFDSQGGSGRYSMLAGRFSVSANSPVKIYAAVVYIATDANCVPGVVCVVSWFSYVFNLEYFSIETLQTTGNGMEYGIVGAETCPTTSRKHYQCYFKYISPVRFSTLIAKLPRGSHVEKAKGVHFADLSKNETGLVGYESQEQERDDAYTNNGEKTDDCERSHHAPSTHHTTVTITKIQTTIIRAKTMTSPTKTYVTWAGTAA